MIPEFHPDAAAEFAAAARFYDGIYLGLGQEFTNELESVLSLLCDAPRIGEPLDGVHRQFPMR
jgi:hypothetical protein